MRHKVDWMVDGSIQRIEMDEELLSLLLLLFMLISFLLILLVLLVLLFVIYGRRDCNPC